MMARLHPGYWLGIDVGSSKQKVATLCAVEAREDGDVTVTFEQGPAGDGYPSVNTRQTMLDPARESYLQAGVEEAIADLLAGSVLVKRCRDHLGRGAVSVAIDAPVAFALEGRRRLTEGASSPTFTTPSRAIFERDLEEKTKEGFFRSVVYWKCVGFAVYRQVAGLLRAGKTPDLLPSFDVLAAWTAGEGDRERGWRLREVFPSDVYKRGNGEDGVLAEAPRRVLARLLDAPWRPASEDAVRAKATMKRLDRWREKALRELAAGGRLESFEKAVGTFGDLLDAFIAAYTACCEEHDGALLHGVHDAGRYDAEALRREGAILTVACMPGRSAR